MLVDCGPSGEGFDAGSRIVVPELKRLGVRWIDVLVLTHDDFDHIGGALGVLQSYRVLKVLTTSEVRDDPRMAEFFQVFRGEVDVVGDSGLVMLGSGRFQVRKGRGISDNDRSLALYGDLGGASVELTADGSAEMEKSLVDSGWGQAELVKAGHHGSGGSNSTLWLSTVLPRYVVVTCGRSNRYGHPTLLAVQRVGEEGAALFRTDRDGTVQFHVKQGHFEREPTTGF